MHLDKKMYRYFMPSSCIDAVEQTLIKKAAKTPERQLMMNLDHDVDGEERACTFNVLI